MEEKRKYKIRYSKENKIYFKNYNLLVPHCHILTTDHFSKLID